MSPKTSSNFHASLINEYFWDAPDLIPSTEITSGSIVYGKIAQTPLANDLEHFPDVRFFLLSKISDMCSHLSLGARLLFPVWRGTTFLEADAP